MNLFINKSNIERSSQDYLWCPWAEIGDEKMVTQGKYRKGFPEGAVIHYTAGRDYTEKDAINSVKWGVRQKYCYFVIGPTGVLYQSFPLSHWGSHAGKSSYGDLKDGVSRYLVGIEVVCSGKLIFHKNGYLPWFHLTDGKSIKGGIKQNARMYEPDEVNYVKQDHKTYVQEGYYKKFTIEQEQSLMQLLLWLKMVKPDVFSFDNVLGHMEVSPFRKADPGGSISMNMIDYRNKLKGMYANNPY